MTLGMRLKQIRQKQNLSQTKLSNLSNVPQTTISNIERDVCSPTVDTLKAITKALKVDITQIIK